MNNNQISKSGNLFSTGFGLIVLAVGIVWLGKSLGMIPLDFNIIKYICPACLILFGIWIIAEHYVKKNQKQS
jgi:uncharacterized membrane protein